MDENLSIAEAFKIAFDHHCAGELDRAEAIYRTILDADPGQPDALHFLGVLLHQRGDCNNALDLVKQSIALEPGRVDWHNDLGNILTACGKPEQAAEAFAKAIRLKPANAMLWNNLGAVQQRLGHDEEAESAFRQAAGIDPGFADALINLGNLLDAQGRSLEAAEFHCRAYVLEPTQDKPKSMLGVAYYKLGRFEEATEIYRQWLQEEPDNPVAAHFYAACSGDETPQRCSEAYIEKTFDEFADRFDEHLEGLSYRGPEMMSQLLQQTVAPESRLDVLDAGCGTGLCGPVLAPYAQHLTGIDLSERMLEQSREHGLYHNLEKADITRYLQHHPDSFDLVTAADTLIYFGDLQPVFAAIYGALRQNGLLAFTVEVDDTESYRLNPHGRYSHGEDYLAAALRDNGFAVLEMKPGIVRVEFGTPVHGLAVIARKENPKP